MDINWLDVVPSVMATAATIAAACAAFISLRISQEANHVSRQSILAAQHGSAAFEISKAVSDIKNGTKGLLDLCCSVQTDWAREIEKHDCRSAGGVNPRPLRHVLVNASKMLVCHGSSHRENYINAQRLMYSILRDGIDLNDSEYTQFLKKADGTYKDFESTFGLPSTKKPILEAAAFRWACYQLVKRVDNERWNEIWLSAWKADGWLDKYQAEFLKMQPVLKAAQASLKLEKSKNEYGVFPIKSNPALSLKYESLLTALEVLLDDCGLEVLESYKEWACEEDCWKLITYSMGLACLASDILESVID